MLAASVFADEASAASVTKIQNKQFVTCAAPESTAPNAYLRGYACELATYNQFWSTEYVGTVSLIYNKYRLSNVGTGYCMGLAGTTTLNGTKVVQQICNAATTQQWHQSGRQLVNEYSGKCLDAPTDGGTILQQWDCGSTSQNNQAWYSEF